MPRQRASIRVSGSELRLQRFKATVAVGGSAVAPHVFTPTDIAGLVGWWDFSDSTKLYTDAGTTLVASDGDAIYQANDKSGGTAHMVQATAGARPLHKVNILNGQSVARCDGSNDYMDAGNMSALFPSAATLVVVATVGAVNYALWGGADGWYANSGAGYHGEFRSARVDSTPPSGEPSSGTHAWVTASGASSYKVWRNGGSAIVSAAAGYLAATTSNLGKQDGGTTLTGDLAEALVYSSALSLTDINSIGTYLASKWGITWTAAT